MTRRAWAAAAAIAVVYLAIASARAARERPWADEAWFFSPALTLLEHGHLGTAVLEPRNPGFEGIDRHTYWVLPLHLVAQAGWYALFGASLFAQRALSIACGLAALAALATLVRVRTGEAGPALAAAALLAVDPAFVGVAANGRMDMMCAALGLAGLATFLALRESRFGLAFAASHALMALGGLTHPNGVLYFAALAALQVGLDHRRLRLPHLAVGSLPYLLAAVALGLYAAQAPADFASQLRANLFGYAEPSHGSLAGAPALRALSSPLDALRLELSDRWPAAYAGYRRLVPLAYLAALAALLLPWGRRAAGRGTLVALAALTTFGLAVFNRKSLFFLVHAVPFLDAVLAAALIAWARRGRPHALAAAAAAAALAALQLAPSVRTVRQDAYHRDFLPAARALASIPRPDQVVRGPAEFAYVLGFDGRYREDAWYGLNTGRPPDVVAFYAGAELVRLLEGRPEIERHLRGLLAGMRPLYRSRAYTVYGRSGTAGSPP